ncbi:MAG: DUF4013 domain-containing protein [Planctomycetaceae bacterium]|nr:DUF4013 domain-containing protein [Planctomycetaceae bacterium]
MTGRQYYLTGKCLVSGIRLKLHEVHIGTHEMTSAEEHRSTTRNTTSSSGAASGEPMPETLLQSEVVLNAVDEQGPPSSHSDSIGDALAIEDVFLTENETRLPPFPVPWRHPIAALLWAVQLLFGLTSLIVLLAVIAAIPLVNLIALGYLLDVEGRVGRSGRLRDGFPLLPLAPRFGSIVLGIWLWLIPLRLLAGATADARLIDAGSPSDTRLHLLLNVMWVIVTVHLCLALARGGSLSCFFRPIKNLQWFWQRLKSRDYLDTASQRVREFVSELRIKHYFWLGLRGLMGGIAWLLTPTALFAAMANAEGPQEPQGMLTLIGGALLALTLSWMPFLQARYATEQRFRSMFHLRTVRRLFKHAPLAWWLAIAIVYVLALPLYLLKVAILPQDAYWLITVVFIVSIYPAKIITGWAYYRALKRQLDGKASPWGLRWLARLGMLPILAAFVFLLYFTQFIGAHGTAGLFEHHAFLLPWPGSPG